MGSDGRVRLQFHRRLGLLTRGTLVLHRLSPRTSPLAFLLGGLQCGPGLDRHKRRVLRLKLLVAHPFLQYHRTLSKQEAAARVMSLEPHFPFLMLLLILH